MHSPASIVPPGFGNHALQLLQKVQHGISPVELVYTTHERWPLRPGHTVHTRPTLRISVLDSSFNPPTLAHLALANSLPPSPITFVSVEPYDARMLLLSVRNADKVFTPGDATWVQRLEMMRLLSYDIHSADSAEAGGESSRTDGNVAVAVIDEPTFVGKSSTLLRFLKARLAKVIESPSPHSLCDMLAERGPAHSSPPPRLTFLLGFDTLSRLFSPKYYPSEQVMTQKLQTLLSPEQDNCRIVCAYRRCASPDKIFQETQDRILGVAHEFMANDLIAFMDIGGEEQTYSSSKVRAQVGAGDGKWRQLVTGVVGNYIIERGIYSDVKEEQ